MADNHTREVRHINMSHIHSKNTKPEEKVRKYLFSRGLRYRKNVKNYPGVRILCFQNIRLLFSLMVAFGIIMTVGDLCGPHQTRNIGIIK